MRSSPLVQLLCNAGLAGSGYRFERLSPAQCESMARELVASPHAIVTELPSVTMVELEREQVLYLVTRPGHFAHPSILKRALHERDGKRHVQVSGHTAAAQDIMATWIGQFREQDEQMARSLPR